MRHRFITLVLLLLGTTFTAKANPVDIRTAREVGMKFMNANTKTPLRNADELLWVTTYNTNRGNAAFHIFNTQGGFVIVSADDCATPILGYSSEGHFDMENIPIQLQEYLQGFVEQIEYGIENHVQADKRTAEQWERVKTTGYLTNNRTNKVVEPLLSTKWSQGCLYNALCPEDEAGECGHVWTGCTATAMAQIMNYWQWPEQGSGEHSYEWNGQTLSANFGETTYDWNNMLDEYYSWNSTQEQVEAVATLMYHCGVSVDMKYAPDGSAATLHPEPLIDYFAYSDEMSFEYNWEFSDASWKAKLRDCLNLNRPLWYIGNTELGSHAFVCDGYDDNDMFHFNWGWAGSNDGYYTIYTMIGDLSYNRAIFNIHPQGETTYYAINVSTDPVEGGVVSGSGTYAHGDSITLTAIPNEGYGFCYWEENGEIFSTNLTFSFTANYNRDFRAVFASLEECIIFDDPKVIEICLTHWDSNGDGKLSYAEAAAVTSLGEVFRGNEWIASFEELEFFTGLTSIDDNAFNGCTNLTGELRIPNSVTTIGNSAFKGCSGFSGNLIIPNSVTTIGNQAFDGCEGFDGDLSIPNSVTTIGNQAFHACGFTGDLTIGDSVTTIGWSAFESNSFTGGLTIPNSVTSIGFFAFHHSAMNWDGFHGLNINITNIPMNFVDYIGGGFIGIEGTFTGPLIIGDAVISIDSSAFYGCSGFTGNLVIPNTVTTIGGSAFNGCSGFSGSLTIPNSVTTIGNSAFANCTGLTDSLTICNSIATIESGAFRDCNGLTSVIIGNSVTKICNEAFSGCSNLNKINVLAETPPSIETNSFYNVNPNIVVMVPCGCLQAYKASAWNDYFTSIMQNCIGITEDNGSTTSIYPNPTDGQVKIEAEGIEHITISNELGQIIYEGKANGNTFEYDFSRHEAGTYLIKIETEDGITTKRVFVTR